MKLSEVGETLAYDAAFWLLGFEAPGSYDAPQLGPISVELCAKLRALAIITLLTKGDTEKFLHTLVRSARVREMYLQRSRQEHRDSDHHFVASRLEGFLDATCAGDFELARRIAWISPRSWVSSYEYEDDYCYAQALHLLMLGVTDMAVYDALLKRHEAALMSMPSPRLDVVRALVTNSQKDFDVAFDALLQERLGQIDSDVARCQLETAPIVAERMVFIEGLALLRLATRAGLTTLPDYALCPSMARLNMRTPVPEGPGAGDLGDEDSV